MSKEFEMILSKLNGLEKDNKEQKKFQRKVTEQLDEQKEFNRKVTEQLDEQKEFQKIVLKQLDEQKKFNKEILKRFDTLEKKVEVIDNDVKEFRKETTNRFNTLERTVTIIEDEVKNNIPALFDSDLTRQQKEESLQSEVDHLRRCISKSFNKDFSSRD